ncbi:FtsQ-type POTRA domain-containing protein [Actinophytocola sp.]|uniref:FtsQ-type POTRA domain-containing protein n=1 Tax=Actinophytocola sp. TaxID=1872138 RepID=UPI002ED46A3F
MDDTRDEDDGEKTGEERRARRTRSTRDRHGRTGTTATGDARTRRRGGEDTETPRRRTAAGKSADQRAAGRSARLNRRDGAGPETTGRSGRRGAGDAESAGTASDGAAGSRGEAASVRRAGSRGRVRGRGEPARPDSSSRGGRTGRDSGRPAMRRSRSDAVRARRSEPGERRPPTRRRYLTRRWVAVLTVLAVLTVAYLVMFTSLLGVRSVEVIGAKEIPEADVVGAAAIEHGTPMVRLDADQAAARVAELPRVFEVRVERSWPSTVEIIVTERSPVAVLRDGDQIHLVDRTGLNYAKVAAAPPGLPVLAMSNVRPDDPATKAAVTVLASIPKQLSDQVTTVTADTPGNVRLTLTDGRLVKWGNANENPRKAAVLAALLTRPGKTYDVATPDFPTVSE